MLINHTVETPIIESFRVRQTRGLFDLPATKTSREEFHVELPELDDDRTIGDWTIGVIVGPSGSGKSTIAQAAYADALYTPDDWPADRAVIDALPSGPIKQITRTLSSVGFASPPSWLKPYRVLSTGEQFRCDLAAALLSKRPLIVFDEFSSVVDRTAAQIGSAAVANALRANHAEKNRAQDDSPLGADSVRPPATRQQEATSRVAGARAQRAPGPALNARQKFIAVTCHYDVLPWLEPDWVLDMADGTLSRGCLRRPQIRLEVRTAPRSAWSGFARHHYLSGQLNPAAVCYVATWNDEPVAFCGVLNSIGHRGLRRISRLVVLPDYQGIGIGGRLMDAIGEIYRAAGDRITITTSHPAVIARLRASTRWNVTSVRRGGSGWGSFGATKNIRATSAGRTVISAEYAGGSEGQGGEGKGIGGKRQGKRGSRNESVRAAGSTRAATPQSVIPAKAGIQRAPFSTGFPPSRE